MFTTIINSKNADIKKSITAVILLKFQGYLIVSGKYQCLTDDA
jgi:hypothetical protein